MSILERCRSNTLLNTGVKNEIVDSWEEDPRSTMPVEDRLERLFTGLQEKLSLHLQRQQELVEKRWEQEKKAAEKVLDRRFEAIEDQLQTLVTKFDQHTSISVPVDSLESRDPIPTTDSRIATALASQSVPSRLKLGYTLKPPIFDGKSSWEGYKIQFEAVACANGWDAPTKALALIASLEGPAQSVLIPLSVDGHPEYQALVSALQARFGGKLFQLLSFQSYKQQKGQSIFELAMEVERLAHATFGDCPIEIRDRLAASQFVSSLADEEMKRALRLGSFANLRAALVSALEIEAVESISQPPRQNRAHTRSPPFFNKYRSRRMDNAVFGKSPKTNQKRTAGRSFAKPRLECWNCGEIGHLQRNCPIK